MNQSLETNAGQLLTEVTDTIKCFEEQWQKTGEKYNLFKVAGIARKELIMCRILADLLNPHGMHCQGSRYLYLFWEAITAKLRDCPALDFEHTRVATEYAFVNEINENRRIDIVLDDGQVFVPMEVKIGAPDLPEQLADYFKFARTKNSIRVPVLYLTLDGHEPPGFSKGCLGKDDYAPLSFKQDILAWLEACARDNTAKTTVPVGENLRQLIAAVKSLCGKSEDAEMEDAIFKLVTRDDDTVRAALAISGVANFRERVLKAFTDTTLALVKASFPNATMSNETYGYDWHYIEIPVRENNYLLQVNYDWTTVWLSASDSCKTDSASQEWANLNKTMTDLFKFEGESVPKAGHVWRVEDISWPSLDPCVNNDERDLYLAHLSKLPPQEAADRIISIAKALESVKA
jgi:hypothetical protein